MLVTSRTDLDVIVVGGGPGGALTAYRLARAGARVLLVDAKRFPREKPCGGGIQQKAFSKIPFTWNSAIQSELREVAFSYNLNRGFVRQCEQGLVSSVLRSEFDELLLGRAEAAGVSVWQECRALRIAAESDSSVTLQTSRGDIRARFAVGADGANSVIAGYLNPRDSYYWQVAMYCEVPIDCLVPHRLQTSCIRIDWGSVPSGYGWIFPKKDSVNIGVGCPSSIGASLKPYLDRFLKAEALIPRGAHARLKFLGHQLPTLTRRTRLSSSRVLLVGDAAGLVEPLTGEGISNACHSAEIASIYILDALAQRPSSISYDENIRVEIGRELRSARQLLSLAVTFPDALFSIFRDNDLVWNRFCRVLRGEDSFHSLKQSIMGRFDWLWTPLRHFSEWNEGRQLRRYRRFNSRGGIAVSESAPSL